MAAGDLGRPRRGGWGPDQIGDLTGAVMMVTGATSGIGYETAVELAAHGAHVVLACRDTARATTAADRIIGDAEGASVEVLELDLADLASVRRAAASFLGRHDRLDVLVNNAGVMATPYRRTPDGLELQMATNHLGHFALTGLVLDRLLTTSGSRVVTVSSVLHRLGRLDRADLDGGRRYHRWRVYGTTKLANLLFTYELDRRLRAAGGPTVAVAAHPGWARSNLAANGPLLGATGLRSRAGGLTRRFGQSATGGALPSLYAATAPAVGGGEYFGPGGAGEQFGPPVRVSSNRASTDVAAAGRLWRASEDLTGVRYVFSSRWSRKVPVERLTNSPSTSRTDASA